MAVEESEEEQVQPIIIQKPPAHKLPPMPSFQS